MQRRYDGMLTPLCVWGEPGAYRPLVRTLQGVGALHRGNHPTATRPSSLSYSAAHSGSIGRMRRPIDSPAVNSRRWPANYRELRVLEFHSRSLAAAIFARLIAARKSNGSGDYSPAWFFSGESIYGGTLISHNGAMCFGSPPDGGLHFLRFRAFMNCFVRRRQSGQRAIFLSPPHPLHSSPEIF